MLKTTMGKIKGKIEILNTMSRTNTNGFIRIHTDVNGDAEVCKTFVIFGMSLVGKFTCTLEELRVFVESIGLGLEDVNEFARLKYLCSKAPEAMNEEFWCFDKEGYLEKFEMMRKIKQPSYRKIEEMKYISPTIDENNNIRTSQFPQLRDGENLTPTGVRFSKAQKLINKENLLDNIISISDRKPVTNDVIMSEKFKIEEKNFKRFILEVLVHFPLLIKGTTYEFYESNGQLNKVIMIPERLYQRLLVEMPNSKDFDVKMIRDEAVIEYMDAFNNMKEYLYNEGLSKDDISDIIETRKLEDKRLRSNIFRLINELGCVREHSFYYYKIFETINKKVGIDSIDKSKNNRNKQDEDTQAKLIWLEGEVIHHMRFNSRVKTFDDLYDDVIMFIKKCNVDRLQAPKF